MPVPYFKHGRRHAPDGEDPIAVAFTSWAYLTRTTAQSITATNQEWIEWTTFAAGDGGSGDVFFTNNDGSSTPNNTSGDRYLMLNKTGVYVIQARGYFAAACTAGYMQIDHGGTGMAQGSHVDTNWASANGVLIGQDWLADTATMVVWDTSTNFPNYVRVKVGNEDGSDRDFNKCYLFVARIPVDPNAGSVTVF